jgi:membrane protease YdiL (CAAX protease family)
LTPRDPSSDPEPGDAPGLRRPEPLEPGASGSDGTPGGPPPADPPPIPAASRPGVSTFTIEGRSAPALFVVGWIATILGLGLIVVALPAGGSPGATALILIGLVLLSVGLVAGAGSQGVERRVRGVLPYTGPSPFLVFAASIPVSVLALVIVGRPLDLLGVPLDGPLAALLSVTVEALVYVGLVRLLVVDAGALDWAAMGVRRLDRSALGEIGGGALWALPVIAITIPLAAGLRLVFPVTPVSPLPPTGEAIGFALSLMAGVVVAPFGEEILFRAFATTAWVRGTGVRRGVVTGALVFAFAHVLTASGSDTGDAFGLAVVGFATRLPIALALGWLFVRRGTVWASFGLHAAFNGILLIAAELASRSL